MHNTVRNAYSIDALDLNLQAGRPKKSFLFGPFFFNIEYEYRISNMNIQYIYANITNIRLLRQKMGGACLYMPQDGHWLASFEVIPPQKS